jgi:hypothetical protein
MLMIKGIFFGGDTQRSFFLWRGRGLNPGLCIFYALSLSTELREQEYMRLTHTFER